MDGDDEAPAATPMLGQRLEAYGRNLAARYTPRFPWARPLAVASAAAVALAQPHDSRFDRVEVDPDAPQRPTPARAVPPPDRALPDSGRATDRLGADLDRADLDRPDLDRPDLDRADLDRADLDGADLDGPVYGGAAHDGPAHDRAAPGGAADGGAAHGGLARGRSGQDQAGHGRGGQDRARRAGALPESAAHTPPDHRPPLRSTADPTAAHTDPADGGAAHTALDDAARSGSAAEQVVAPTGVPLSPAVRARLRDQAGVGEGADAMRVHVDAAADALARSHRADAVALGRDVHFRAGRYRPHDADGLALLAHEATHVQALLDPGAAWQRATGAGRADEEAAAAAAERAVSRRLPTPLPERTAPAAAPSSGGPAAVPMTALAGRDVSPEASRLDMAAMRRDLVQSVLGDLRRQLRTEFERGG